MPGLTLRQQAIYELIVSTVEQCGYQPTYREICDHFGIRSPNAVRTHLASLEKKGLIQLSGHVANQQARAILLVGMRFQRIESGKGIASSVCIGKSKPLSNGQGRGSV